MNREEAKIKFKEGLMEAVRDFITTFDGDIQKKAGFEFDEEERLKNAIDNAIYTLTHFDVGAIENVYKILNKECGEKTRFHLSGTLDQRVSGYVRQFKHGAEQSHVKAKKLLEDFTVMLRSLEIQHQIVGMAGTHHEKNARMRGLVAYISGLVSKLRTSTVDYYMSSYPDLDLFRSEYPLSEVVSKAKHLANENKALRDKLKELNVSEEEINEIHHQY